MPPKKNKVELKAPSSVKTGPSKMKTVASSIKTRPSSMKAAASTIKTGPSTMTTGQSSTIYPSTAESTTSQMLLPYDRYGVGSFPFWNGDVYEGEYWATTEKTYTEFHIYRDGFGTYRTADGQVYVSLEWRQDQAPAGSWLDVYFQDGGRYSGEVRDLAYNGAGSYIFRDGAMLNCWWQDGRPRHSPMPVITDPYGRQWLALPQVQTQENGLCFVAPVRFLPVEPEDEEELPTEAEGDYESTVEEEMEEELEPELIIAPPPSRATGRKA